MVPLKTSLALVSAVPRKIISTLLLYILRAILLLLTTCKRFMSSRQNFLLIIFYIVVIVLYLLYRINSKHQVQTPLFSFPSLSRPLVSFTSISLSQSLPSFRSIPRPLVSIPSISLQAIFKKYSVIQDTVVPSAPPEPDQNSYDGMDSPDEQGNMSMEDAWNAILARGDTTPIKLKHSDIQDSTLERVVRKAKEKNCAIGRKKKEKRAKKVEEKSEGLRQRDALVTPHDDLSRHADAFIKKHNDYLKLQREESSQRRYQLEWRRITDNSF